jgi:hypothetical protein
MLNHFQLCVSKREYSELSFSEGLTTEDAAKSRKEVTQLLRIKDNSKLIALYLKNINHELSEMLGYYNLIVKEFFSLSKLDQKLFFKWFYSIFYSNRGFLSNVKLTQTVIDSIIASILAEDATELTVPAIERSLPNLDTIVDKLIKGINKKEFKPIPVMENPNFHLTGSAGPNGSPAMLTLPLDCKALLNNTKLLESIEQLGEKFGIIGISEALKKLEEIEFPDLGEDLNKQVNKDNPVDSKLFIFQEAGGKWRVVAEVDSITQTVLNPIHNVLSSISNNLEYKSGHFDQDTAFESLFEKAKDTGFLGTCDLKSATDYLDINIQALIIDKIFNRLYELEGVGDLWKQVISKNRAFTVHKHENPDFTCSYKVGQPMGAKSSWVAMHLTMVVIAMQAEIIASDRCKSGIFEGYFSITGDDCEFADPDTYTAFMEIMDELGMRINKQKSYNSLNIDDPEMIFGEYLKKISFNGDIVIPASGRTGGKFFAQPKQQLFNYINLMLNLDLEFDLYELIEYCFIKDELFFKNNPEDDFVSEDRLIETYKGVLEQIWYWLMVTPELGGLNYPYENFLKLVKSKDFTIFDSIEKLNSRVSPSTSAEARMIVRKIMDFNYKSEERSKKAISSVFERKGMTKIANIIQKALISEGVLIVDWNDLETFLTKGMSEKVVKAYPIFRVIFTILFTQHQELLEKLEKIREELSLIEKPNLADHYGEVEINKLSLLLKRAKKELRVIDINVVLEPDLDLDNDNQTPLSKNSVKMLKNVFYLESQIDEDRKIRKLTKELF